jgi:hypothetical protein
MSLRLPRPCRHFARLNLTRRTRKAACFARRAATPHELSRTPFLLIGSVAEMTQQLRLQAEHLGITRYVVREPAIDIAERILAALAEPR